MPAMRDRAHTALGVVTIDLLVVVVAGAVWSHVLRAPVAALLPPLAARWSAPTAAPHDARWARRWLLAAFVGVLTHVVWDSFTHDDGWAVRRIGLLDGTVAGVGVALGLQYLCSALGLVLVAAFVLRWWRTTAPRAVPPVGVHHRAVWAAVAVAMAVGGGYRAATDVVRVLGLAGSPPEVGSWRVRILVTDLLLGAGVAFVLAVLLLSVGWHVHGRLTRSRPPSPAEPAGPAGRRP
jgi:hypothetical protein